MENSSKHTFEKIVTSLEENDVEKLKEYIRDNTKFAGDLKYYYNNKKTEKTELSTNYLLNSSCKLQTSLSVLDPMYIQLMISMIEDQKQFTVLTEKSIPITLSMMAIFISSASLLNLVTKSYTSLSVVFEILGFAFIALSICTIIQIVRLNKKIKYAYFKNRNMDMLIVLLKNINYASKN